MAGNRIGGLKARDKNIKRFGPGFYQRNGALGGSAKTTKPKGFASDVVGEDGLTGRQRASIVGVKGGRKSRRTKVTNE